MRLVSRPVPGRIESATRARVSETTVRRELAELAAGTGLLPEGRVRAPGGGRRRAEDYDPAVLRA